MTSQSEIPPNAVLERIDLNAPELYINRELSWLEFNERVLQEAEDRSLPLLERVRFLGIFSTNLDEFYMIRVSGVKKQVDAGVIKTSVDGMTPSEQLTAIHRRVLEMKDRQLQVWQDEILPALEPHGVRIFAYAELNDDHQDILRTYFRQEIMPVLTPLAVDPGRPFPHISNLSLNLAIVLEDEDGHSRFARLKVPTTEKFPRFVQVNEIFSQFGAPALEAPYTFVHLEDIIQANLDLLFPGMTILQAYPFKVIRDADVDIAEDEMSDLLSTIEQGVQRRQFGEVVQLIVSRRMPEQVRHMLMTHLGVMPRSVYEMEEPLGLADLFEIVALDLVHLKYPSFVPARSPDLPEGDVFAPIREGDILVHHPYESFDTTADFIQQAATDPNVLAIKISLYRVGSNSPVVQALLEARDNGKQVAVMVELKARFDEENNITWAKALEAQGVHVVYGLVGLKTHAKIALVVRREGSLLRRYVHMSTGNYNASTARIYSDLGFYSCREDLAEDITQLFNRITGFAPKATYRKLLVAPEGLRDGLMRLFDREIEHANAGRPARMIIKANAITDAKCIRKLYEASRAGVQIDMIIRGISRLRPGIPGVSDNIHVRSIVGRFLEHSRVYWFANGGNGEVYLGSADLMERNLDRRVEQLFPVEDSRLKRYLYSMVTLQLRDNVGTRVLQPDGSYIWLEPGPDEEPIDAQQILLENRHDLLNLPLFE